MQHVAALVVILFVNGVQIPMPAPAVVEGETTWIPLRAVCEELGWQVGWDGATNSIKITTENQPQILIQVGKPQVTIGSETVELTPAPQRRDGVTYIPAKLLRAIPGVEMRWDNEQKALHINALPTGEPVAVTISELVTDPPGWLNEVVSIAGEYTGWQGNPFSPATSQGPPVTRSDWTIRDATGSIYCSARSALSDSPIALRPYEDYGRRIMLTGTVRLAPGGFPYLEPTEILPITGREGLTCFVTTDRYQYSPGDTVVIEMTVANPFPGPVTLQFMSGQTYDFIIRDAKGNNIWQWSDDKVFTMALVNKQLKAGESYKVSTRWTVPVHEKATSFGRYRRIFGIVNASVLAYPHTIEITGQR